MPYDTWYGLLLLEDFVNTFKKEKGEYQRILNKKKLVNYRVKNAGFDFNDKGQAGFVMLGLSDQYEFLFRDLRANDNLNMTRLKYKLLKEVRRVVSES